MKPKTKPEAKLLFEASWEVCNKVGGIHRVIESKAALTAGLYRGNYWLVGPYFSGKAKGEFQEKAPPAAFKKAFAELEKEGVRCRAGKWLVEGEPNAVLIDFSGLMAREEKKKKGLWERYGIDSLNAGPDYTEPLVWAWAAGKTIGRLAPLLGKSGPAAAQFHEWLAGAGLLYLKEKGAPVGTVFTTHATVLGRTLANAGAPLYSLLEKISPDKEARRLGIQAKHGLEKSAAAAADVFSTVSEITAIEAARLLERKPDIVLPNGLDIGKFPTFEEAAVSHRKQRSRIREFLLYYFFPYYSFNLKKTLFYFIVGRYEFRNKGVDIFIRALGKLNKLMKKEKSAKTIVAFFWIPAGGRGAKPEVAESKEIFRDIKDSLEDASEEIEENILYALAAGEKPREIGAFGDGEKGFLKEIRKKALKFRRKGLPPPCAHELPAAGDPILASLKKEGLENKKEDRVKAVFLPIYLSGSDGLFNLNYYESIQGSHLGVFPSFYEPWGYTPLETAALGVSSVTTDLSGFGRFLRSKGADKENKGIFVLERFNRSDEEAAEDLAAIMRRFSRLSKSERARNKVRAKKTAGLADWAALIENYVKAHNMAAGKRKKP